MAVPGEVTGPHGVVNPWTWQESSGYVQAVTASAGSRWVFVAGQTAMDDEGTPVHAGDVGAQALTALDNVETVLRAAGAELAHVVRLTVFTTQVDPLLGAWEPVVARLKAAGCRPAASLLGVASLAFPELLVELEVTALVP